MINLLNKRLTAYIKVDGIKVKASNTRIQDCSNMIEIDLTKSTDDILKESRERRRKVVKAA